MKQEKTSKNKDKEQKKIRKIKNKKMNEKQTKAEINQVCEAGAGA